MTDLRGIAQLAGLLSLLSPALVSAQECAPLTSGDTVRVTQTFWTLRPEYGLETRSHQVEFGRVVSLSPDSITFDGANGRERLAFADSVSVARLCLTRVRPMDEGRDRPVEWAVAGALLGAGIASCELREGLGWWEQRDGCNDDVGDVLLGVAIGGALGYILGAGWSSRDRIRTEWTWVDGTPEEGGGLSFVVTPGVVPGSWRLAVRLGGG